MRSFSSLKLTFWRWLARHASSVLWRACAGAPGRFGSVIALGNVGLNASQRSEDHVARIVASFDPNTGIRDTVDAALEAREVRARLRPFAQTTARAIKRIDAFEQTLLAGVPEIEFGHEYLTSVSRILILRPITLKRALALAGFSRPQDASVGADDLEKINGHYGSPACGNEPRVITVARRAEPELVAAWLLPIVQRNRLSAAHLRGGGNVWWDILDREVALPPWTTVFVRTPPIHLG